MPSRLNPYIQFDGNAREAMEFYRDVFGGTLTVSTFAEYGTTGPEADNVMHAQLETGSGYTLMGADTPPGGEYRTGSSITLSLSGDDGDELRGYFTRLADGGRVEVALEKQMWGDEFGQCVDRYGVGWLVNIAVPES